MLAKIAITNYPFDNSYRDTLARMNPETRNNYFKFDEIFADAETVNFKINDGRTATVTYRPNAPNLLSDINKNYCIIAKSADDQEKRYYFVNRITYDISGQYILDLELDVFMTYFNGADLRYTNVRRAYKTTSVYRPDSSYQKWALNTNKDTQIVSAGKFPKRCVNRLELNFVHNSKGRYAYVEEWLNNNVVSYEIYLCKPNNYEIKYDGAVINKTIDYFNTYDNKTNILKQPFTAFVVPRFKQGKRMYISSGGRTRANVIYSEEWIESAVTSANIYAKIVARYLPINLSDMSSIENIVITSDELEISVSNLSTTFYTVSTPTGHAGLICMPAVEADYDCVTKIPNEYRFADFDRFGDVSSPQCNWQVNYDCREIALVDGLGEMVYKPLYTADMYSKDSVTGEHIPFLIKAKILVTPTGVKSKAYITTDNDDSVYNEVFSGLANGLNTTTSNQISVAEAQIDIFMANNKNFVGLMATNAIGATFGGGVGGFNSTANGRTSQGASMNLNVNPLGGALSAINSYLEYDNLNNAPDNIRMAGVSPEYNIAVLKIALYIELRESLPSIINSLVSDTYYNGYYLNEYYEEGWTNISVKDGHFFAPLTADVGEYVGKIPLYAKNIIKQVLARGVRMWYDYE